MIRLQLPAIVSLCLNVARLQRGNEGGLHEFFARFKFRSYLRLGSSFYSCTFEVTAAVVCLRLVD